MSGRSFMSDREAKAGPGSLPDLKRYTVESSSGCSNCYAEESPDGDLVEYADALAAIAAARAEEREACAKIADTEEAAAGESYDAVAGCTARGIAELIRARGQ
jgi:hypothetical protein